MANNLSTQKSLDRQRAQFAYQCAETGKNIRKNKEYKAYVKKIPMLIKANGLALTFAFIKAKSSNEQDKPGYAYHLIYQQTTDWLKEEPRRLIANKLSTNQDDLVKVIIELNSAEYRAITNEVLAFFVWLKRFAEGLIEGD